MKNIGIFKQVEAAIINSDRLREAIPYLIIVVVSFFILQSTVVVMHEFTHSTTAWVLGDLPSPFDIVWGNPLMMTGWDEGVDYHKLVAEGRYIQEALIGGSPLLMHALIVTWSLIFLQKESLVKRKWLFHAVFWFTAANCMELIAYIWMRPFSSHGDTGHFNHGLGLSPWILFILGSSALVFGLYVFYQRVLPRAHALFARGNPVIEWTILGLSAFIMFLWGSGIRVMAYVSGPQRFFGLLGVLAFIMVVFLFRPKQENKIIQSS